MKLLFFPTVRHRTSCLKRASFFILPYEGACLPVRTNVPWVVVEDLRFSSEVLPVVSILTHSLVVLWIVRAPFSFEVVDIEVRVFVHLVNETRFDLSWRMSERAELPILTFIQIFGVPSTESGLIFLYVVEPFNPVMRKFALFLLWTFISLLQFTKVWTIRVAPSSLILVTMVE